MKGYKAFNSDLTCRGFQYEIGKTYETKETISLCKSGFHFCKKIEDCFMYYSVKNTRFAEIEALGKIIEDGNKCVTNVIRIIKEIPYDEAMRMSNTGTRNVGSHNVGSYNVGRYNVGRYNNGSHNVGNYNRGHYNDGSYNDGSYNVGRYNRGHYNEGRYNIGSYNKGNWNVSNHNNGCFNTVESKITLFNKPSNWTYADWEKCEAKYILEQCPYYKDVTQWVLQKDMTEKEKIAHPEYKVTGGYLKVVKNTVNNQKWWNSLFEGEKQKVMNLPNFDAEIFKECTGIDIDVERK